MGASFLLHINQLWLYYRWGDAPVHSIAVGIFLNKSEVHFFNDVGYKHDPFMHCPVARELQKKCHCNAEDNFGNVFCIPYFEIS